MGNVSASTHPVERTILVVDDNESVVVLAARILRRAGYRVVTATEGPGAVEVFAQNAEVIGAAVVDVTMPGMSAEELLAALRGAGLRVPVVLSSGFAAEEIAGRFAPGRVSAFLPKPYRSEELLAAVARALDGGA